MDGLSVADCWGPCENALFNLKSYLNVVLYIYILLSFYACVSIAFFQPPHETPTFILFSVSNLSQTGLLFQTGSVWVLGFKAGIVYKWRYKCWRGTMWVSLHVGNLWLSSWQVCAWETRYLIYFYSRWCSLKWFRCMILSHRNSYWFQ